MCIRDSLTPAYPRPASIDGFGRPTWPVIGHNDRGYGGYSFIRRRSAGYPRLLVEPRVFNILGITEYNASNFWMSQPSSAIAANLPWCDDLFHLWEGAFAEWVYKVTSKTGYVFEEEPPKHTQHLSLIHISEPTRPY